ncbi:sodium/proline symporter PutP [Bartonella sp. DGB2]|uniref:sodium/proline symporter PutP n=1 Tax=Bartonella sp. DGB2 TaxID=3388426 RepID=UPI003990090F
MFELSPLLITFIIYIGLMVAIGVYAYRHTQKFDDYILGGRRFGRFVTAMSVGASDMSGWLLMGLPGAIYLQGLSQSWIAVGLLLGALLNWYLVGGRLRVQTEVFNNSLTLPDFFSNRFQDKHQVLRVVSAFIILIFFTIYCASGIVAGARLFETTFGFSYGAALLAGTLATILYTFLGGFLAVSWTDTVQASLMIFALILTPIVVIYTQGGFTETMASIESVHPNHANLFYGVGAISILSSLGWGFGYFGQPHILARFMASQNHQTVKRARRIAMTWMFLCLSGAIIVGYFGVAYFANHPDLAVNVQGNSERIFIELTRLLFNPWIAGVLLSAVLAAVMSTLSCQLLVCASAITEDFYRPFFRKNASQRELIYVGRAMVLAVAAIALTLALNPESKVLDLVSYAWAGFGAAFGSVIIVSLFWGRTTSQGALAGMIVGAATVILWKNYGLWGLYEIIPGFILATATVIVVSLISPCPSPEVAEQFKKAQQKFQT